MTTENSQSEAQSDTETPNMSASTPASDLPGEAPKLNREQRRAQAKGKQSASSGFHSSNTANREFSGGNRPANAPIQNKIPRTGHK